jgi:hypothetical protein
LNIIKRALLLLIQFLVQHFLLLQVNLIGRQRFTAIITSQSVFFSQRSPPLREPFFEVDKTRSPPEKKPKNLKTSNFFFNFNLGVAKKK